VLICALQNLSSCVVLDDDSADETATGASAATTTANKPQANLTQQTVEASDSTRTKYSSPRTSTAHSKSFTDTAGICNPGFNFDDDEEEKEKLEKISNFHTVHESLMEEPEDEDQNQMSVTQSTNQTFGNKSSYVDSKPFDNTDVSRSKRQNSNGKPMRESRYEIKPEKESPQRIIRRDSKKSKSKSIPLEEYGEEADTDEDAASLSMSTTVSEASTVVPGEGAYGGAGAFECVRPSKDRKIKPPVSENNGVSQPHIVRRASVKSQKQSKLASGEGNVKIVEIKSRDVVQGILRMEPKLGSNMGGKDHVAIVKVPLAQSQKQLKQKSRNSSVSANNAQQSASSNRNVRGSASSQESRDGNSQKVRLDCDLLKCDCLSFDWSLRLNMIFLLVW